MHFHCFQRKMGSTSVDLGFVENDFESWETESRHFPSKVSSYLLVIVSDSYLFILRLVEDLHG